MARCGRGRILRIGFGDPPLTPGSAVLTVSKGMEVTRVKELGRRTFGCIKVLLQSTL